MGYWTTEGPIRGNCGHKHFSLEEAQNCCLLDNRIVQRLYGGGLLTISKSDRFPTYVMERCEQPDGKESG